MQVRRLLCALALFAFVAVARAQDQKSPLERAKAGEWILQKSVASGYTSWMYMWVSKVEGRKISIRTQMLKDENTGMLAAQESLVDLDQKGEPRAHQEMKATTSEEDLTIKGKKIHCTRVEATVDTPMGKMTTVTWSSPEIPLYGLAKSQSKDKDGKVVSQSEVVDYGRDGGKDKPVK